MSKDSSHTYIHLHHSHHADLFEEFCHPPSSSSLVNSSNNLNTQTPASATNDPSDPSLQHIPGHFLPFESINLPPHLMPLNPEDEDGVVPDMHAAFGIARAMGQAGVPESSGERSGRGLLGGQGREDVWRDFGLDELVAGVGRMGVSGGGSSERGKTDGARREGRRGGILSVR
ncbi:hypothetical protein LTR70_004186 [Exophiala xenobiotica]|uniref:Anaphase-promoting complex subunit 13 n=1 Tax=Lithohypha guttulata TaxID=1690604 RepID=A0ABR0KEJ3_9EURO|nr:hypothetical protein LTR24_003668 [Lithohypha guttulata]KAK5321473.1 hypothetical protein LTR70_004186 [Exophiala xenobiotica]